VNRAQRYLAREILRPVFGIVLFLVVVVLVFYASQLFARAAAEGLPMEIVMQMALIRMLLYLDVLMPAAVMLGIVIGLGRLQAGYEIIALAAAGAGSRTVFLALAPGVLLLVALVAVLTLYLRPLGYELYYQLEEDMAAEVDVSRIEPGRFQVGDRQWVIFAEGASNGGLDRVLVHQRHDHFNGILTARRLDQEDLDEGRSRLIFSGDVHSYRIEPDGQRDLIGRFDRFAVEFETRPARQRAELRRAMPTVNLLSSTAPIEIAELHWRIVGPISMLALALIGVAMSRINPRHGQAARVMLACLVATLYYSVLSVLMNWLEQASWPEWPGLYLAPMMIVLIVLLRFWRVQRSPGAPL